MCATASCAAVFVSAGGPRARPGVVVPAEAAASSSQDSAWMGDRSGRLISTRARVDRVASDH